VRVPAAIAAVLSVTVGVSACTAETPESPSTATPGAVVTPSPSSAAELTAPLDDSALIATFEELAESMKVPGAAMLVRTPDQEIMSTYGTTELGGAVPVTLDDHIRVGSNTKPWMATVILQLVQEGLIALDDPVSKYRPEVPDGDNISIEELLNMRSGLFNYSETYTVLHENDLDPQRVWTPEELVDIGISLPPYFAPDDGFHYSNTNYLLLGLIAEQIEQRPLGEIFRERLFDPLDLTETSYPAADDASLPAPYARGYMYTDNVRTITTFELPADLRAQVEAGSLLPNDQTDANPSWAGAAGAGISTIRELATLVEAMVGGGLLDPDLQKQRLQSGIPPVPDAPSTYGWGLIHSASGFFEHGGLINGYNSHAGYDPVNKVTVVVWTNLSTDAAGAPPAATIAKALIDQMYD
jgi:D-alanyl-D-alanine carboxypeptidase